MPVQINEVVVRATVSDNSNRNNDNVNNGHVASTTVGQSIDEIVDKVLEILKSKSER